MYYDCNELAEIERKIKDEKPFLVVVDQLTQVKPSGRSATIRDRYIEVTNALKRIALTENVCIICVHQLNRTSTDQKKPRLENLAESDSVGRDADVVLMLATDDEEEYNELKMTELIVIKNRQGRAGQSTLLAFHGARYTFSETTPASWEKAHKETEIIL